MRKIIIANIIAQISLLHFSMVFSKETFSPHDEYKRICKMTPKYCPKLKDRSGKWSKPARAVLLMTKKFIPYIKKVAKKYGIDERAIVGSIIIENGINNSYFDDIQNILVKSGLFDNGELLGKEFTFGFGQIKMSAALPVEQMAAKIDKRKVRTVDEISKALLKPEESIRYMAAIIRKAQDDYMKQGFDISNRPGLLATLYNIGKSEQRVKRSVQEGKAPSINYYGFFVLNNMKQIDDLLGNKKIPNNNETSSLKKTREYSSKIAIYQSPSRCQVGNDDEDIEYQKLRTKKNFPKIGEVSLGDNFYHLSRSIDCDFESWNLIGSGDGKKMGWVKKDDLDIITYNLNLAPSCLFKQNDPCKAKIINSLGNKLHREGQGKLFIKMESLRPNPTWRYPAEKECLEHREKKKKKKNRTMLTKNGRNKLKKAIDLFKKRVLNESKTEVDYFTDSRNPYAFLSNSLNLYRLSECADQKSENSTPCFQNVLDVLPILPKIKIVPHPSWSDLSAIMEKVSKVRGISNNQYYNQTPKASALEKMKKKKEVHQVIEKCLSLRKITKSTQKKLREYQKYLEENDYQPLMQPYTTKIWKTLTKFCVKMSSLQITQTFQKDCEHCMPEIDLYLPNIEQEMRFSLQTFKKMIANPNEKKKLIYDQVKTNLDSLKFSFQETAIANVNNDEKCSYLPIETAKKIQNLLKLSCVEKVFVPDHILLTSFYNDPSRVLYKPFIEEDIYELKLKAETCE